MGRFLLGVNATLGGYSGIAYRCPGPKIVLAGAQQQHAKIRGELFEVAAERRQIGIQTTIDRPVGKVAERTDRLENRAAQQGRDAADGQHQNHQAEHHHPAAEQGQGFAQGGLVEADIEGTENLLFFGVDVAGGVGAGRFVVDGCGNRQDLHPAGVDEGPGFLHVLEGGGGNRAGMAADAARRILVDIVIDLSRVLREHHQPFLVEDADVLDSSLLADVADHIADRLAVGAQHGIAGRFDNGVRQVGRMFDGIGGHIRLDRRVQQDAADDDEAGDSHGYRDYRSGTDAFEHCRPLCISEEKQ